MPRTVALHNTLLRVGIDVATRPKKLNGGGSTEQRRLCTCLQLAVPSYERSLCTYLSLSPLPSSPLDRPNIVSYTMSILQRNALLENASMGMVPVSAPPGCLTGRPTAASSKGLSDKRTHVRTPKRVNQEMGFLRGGTLYMTVRASPASESTMSVLASNMRRPVEGTRK